MAKEALFNVLENRIDFSGLGALDLFSGTGNITFEFASRGVARVVAVDAHFKCIQYINTVAKKLNMTAIKAVKADALKFIPSCKDQFDLVFADPPYDLPQLPQIPNLVFAAGLLKPGAWLILEHASTRKLETSPHWVETRKYGYSSFSFYRL